MQTNKIQNNLLVLTFGEFWDRFSVFGTLTILALYLSSTFSFSDNKSYTIYGLYLALSFGMPVVGGILADRLIGFRQAMIIGAILMIVGNLTLFLPRLEYVYLGLALTTCGIGLYKTSCTSMVGNLYLGNHSDGERGFTIFYIGMNIGAILGPLMYGFISIHWGLRYGFLCNAIGIALGLIVYLTLFDLKTYTPPKKYKSFVAFLLIAVACYFIYFLLVRANLFSHLIEFLPIIILLAIIPVIIKYPKLERNRVIALLVLTLFFVFFFAVSLQVGSSIIMFIKRDIHRVIFGWQIPTATFNSLDPLFAVLAAPIFAVLWKYKQSAVSIKLVTGLLLASISMVCFMLAAHASINSINWHALSWILAAYIFLGGGEICLAPAMFNAISQYAPKKLYGTMFGINYLAVAFAGFFSSMLAKISSQNSSVYVDKLQSAHLYSHTFMINAITTAVVAIILFILSSWILSLLKDQQK